MYYTEENRCVATNRYRNRCGRYRLLVCPSHIDSPHVFPRIISKNEIILQGPIVYTPGTGPMPENRCLAANRNNEQCVNTCLDVCSPHIRFSVRYPAGLPQQVPWPNPMYFEDRCLAMTRLGEQCKKPRFHFCPSHMDSPREFPRIISKNELTLGFQNPAGLLSPMHHTNEIRCLIRCQAANARGEQCVNSCLDVCVFHIYSPRFYRPPEFPNGRPQPSPFLVPFQPIMQISPMLVPPMIDQVWSQDLAGLPQKGLDFQPSQEDNFMFNFPYRQA